MIYEKKRKQIINISRILIAISFLFIILIPGVQADGDDTLPHVMLERINEGFTSDIITIFSEDDAFYDMMTTSEKNNQPAIVSNVFNALKAVGALAALAIALIHMLEAIQRGQDGTECAFKCVTEIAIVILILMNLEKFMGGIVALGVSLIESIPGVSPEPDTSVPVVTMVDICGKETISGISIAWFQAVIMLFIPWVISWIMAIFVKFTAYSFLLEIGIRRAFAPLACCDIYAEGFRSPGVRYMKRFLAVFVKIMICIFTAFLAQTLAFAVVKTEGGFSGLGDVYNFIFGQIAINFTAIGIMGKASEYANDIVGV